VVYLILSNTLAGVRYYMTVDELLGNPANVGRDVRLSGAVIGDSIQYDSENLIIDFTISNIPAEFDNLAFALHESVNDPNATRLPVHIENEVMPDLLQHEAQAILEGSLGEDGVFYATNLLLKCPTRFEEAGPNQDIAQPSA
jgi:cytochrome c-type biogenesis protein CcmE